MSAPEPRPETTAPHVLVVDDDARIRDLLKRFLQRHGFLVTAARDAAHAERLFSALVFDVMVLDVMMEGEDGVSFIRRIRDDFAAPVLLLTARGETAERIEGLEAGADDYLVKPFEPRELLLRINAILRRAAPSVAPPAQPVALTLGTTRYDLARGALERDGAIIRLTTSEQALMRVFARQPNEPIPRARLAEELGGAEGEVQERAVDVQITRLRRKIETDPKTPRYLQTVRGAGYMLTPD
jgi:two-component system phosphate regulon response regulator OmpR